MEKLSDLIIDNQVSGESFLFQIIYNKIKSGDEITI